MEYSIGDVARMFNLSVYTLRYYDKEGLLPNVERAANGVRVFRESDLDSLKLIECLKATGMPIKDIKTFIDWCSKGDSTLRQRYNMFIERKAIVEAQMEELKKALAVIEHKCKYYQNALEASKAAAKTAKNA